MGVDGKLHRVKTFHLGILSIVNTIDKTLEILVLAENLLLGESRVGRLVQITVQTRTGNRNKANQQG